MGCSNSMTFGNKNNPNNEKISKFSSISNSNIKNIKSKSQINALNNTSNILKISETSMIKNPRIVTLENQDILDRLLSKPLVKLFLEKIFAIKRITSEMETEFRGLFSLIKSEYEDLEKRFEIKFSIPTSTFEVDLRSFKIQCNPCSDVDLDLYIPLFLFEIAIYPKSFLKLLKIKEFVFINSLTFCTSEYEQYRAACPEYYKTFSLYYCAKERFPTYIRTVIHHELFHYVDFIHDGTYDDPKFNKLNTLGFKYGKGGAYEREWKPLNPELKGFLNFYSTTGIEEDKAEIFQYIMAFPEKAFKYEDEIVNKKIFYIANFMKEFDKESIGNIQNDFFGALIKHRSIYNY